MNKSERSFAYVYRALITLISLEIIASASIVILSEYVKFFIQSHIFQIDKHGIMQIIVAVKICALNASFCFCCGFAVTFTFNDVYTRHMRILAKLWIFISTESVIGLIISTWLFVDSIVYALDLFETSLMDGLKFYVKEPHWILIWDDLQYNFKCCGVQNHTDWIKHHHNMSWLPYSCAKVYVPETLSLSEENIYLNGCYGVMVNKVEDLKLFMIIINSLIIVFLVSCFCFKAFLFI
jgi:hypothetical protein